MFQSVKEIFSSVPAVIWSGVVGAFIALFGVWVQNIFQSKRQKEQLAHDAEQRRLEREMDMRREVYFKVAESLARLQEFLANFIRNDISLEQNQDSIKGVWAEVYKAYIIGSIETIKSLNTLYEVFTISHQRIIEKRLIVNQFLTEISDTQSKAQEVIKFREQLIIVIQAAQEANQPHLLNDFLSKFKIAVDETREQFNQAELNQKLVTANIELIKEVSKATQEYEKASADADIAVRREINFAIDELNYRKMIADTGANVRKQLEQWVNNLSN